MDDARAVQGALGTAAVAVLQLKEHLSKPLVGHERRAQRHARHMRNWNLHDITEGA